MAVLDVETPHGTARIHLDAPREPAAALVLGHGAAGGIGAPDLVAAKDAAASEGIAVALVEQPYRVAGRRSPPRAPQLDEAWVAAVEDLRGGELRNLPLVTGGRSMGARVACRTAHATGAVAVLCLAFPLEPPGGRGTSREDRLAELEAVRVPTLVVQGDRDPFGIPPAGPRREVVLVRGDHGLKSDVAAIAAALREWLPRVVGAAARPT